MKKKWISALLAIITVLSVFLTACGTGKNNTASGEDNEDGEKTVTLVDNTKARTVTLLGITDESTTEEGIARVEALLNQISKTKYKTQIKLVLKTEDEYADYVDSVYKFQAEAEEAAEEASKKAKAEAREKRKQEALEREKSRFKSKWTTTAETEPEETEEEVVTETDANGRVMLKYPDATENQVDIVFSTGSLMFHDFYYKDYFIGIDEDMESECNAKKDLKKYIYPLFMKATDVNSDGTTHYGYANNHVGGMIKYLIVDKTLADKYGFDPSSVKQMMDCEAFLDAVKEGEKDVVPLNYVPDMAYVDFFGEKNGMIGAKYYPLYNINVQMNPSNLYIDEEYTAYLALRDKLENKGYTSEGKENEKYAIRVMDAFYNTFYDENGKPLEKTTELEKDYYIVEYEKAFAKNENVFAGVYSVSSYSKNPTRALEIINLLSTDPEFVTAFAYGQEGKDYTVNPDGSIHRLGAGYKMKLEYCGNSYMAGVPEEYLADFKTLGLFPEDMKAEQYWDMCKAMNLYTFAPTSYTDASIGTSYIAPFTFMAPVAIKDDYAKTIETYKKYYDKYHTRYLEAPDKAAYFESIYREIGTSAELQKCLNPSEKTSLASLYLDQFSSVSERFKSAE